MAGLWALLAVAVGGSGLGGLLGRLLLLGRTHRLAKSIERLDALLASLDDNDEVEREAVVIARRLDILSIAALDLMPSTVLWRPMVVAAAMIYPVVIGLVATAEVLHVIPTGTIGEPSISWWVWGALLLQVGGMALMVVHTVDRVREVVIDHAMKTGRIDWSAIRIYRRTSFLNLRRRARNATQAAKQAPKASPQPEG